MLVDYLADDWGLSWSRRGRARQASGERLGQAVILLKPQTYMNRSGAVLASLRQDPEFDCATELLVAVDDVALPLGKFRLRARGSAGGHNGLKSVEGSLRSQEYSRLRIGVGPMPPGYFDLADYVLEQFESDELEAVREMVPLMAQAADVWIEHGIEAAMNRYNRSLEEM